jgi:uncharacterized membrane protein SpoIIM required for sporulation
VLWLGIVGVMIIALLLIRVGIAHFQREYLLGREIDNINLKWMAKTFVSSFIGEARSLFDWYARVLSGAMRRILPAVFFVTLIAGVSIWASYAWIKDNVSEMVALATPEDLAEMGKNISELGELPDLSEIQGQLSAPFLFLNNTRAVAIIFLAGMVSFGVLGIMLYMINIAFIGGVYALVELLGLNSFQIFLAGVVPHGIFEIPALMIGSAVVLYFSATLVTPQTGKSMGEVILELLADWAKIFIGLVVPLLAIAALIEAYISPRLLLNVIGG